MRAVKRCGLLKVLVNPQWRFLRGYFIRLGFWTDGGVGVRAGGGQLLRRKYLGLLLSKGLEP